MILDFSNKAMKLVFEISDDGYAMLKKLGVSDTEPLPIKQPHHAAICELHVTGENPLGRHGAYNKDLYGSKNLKYVSHTESELADGKQLEFLLTDGKLEVTAHYRLYNEINVVRSWTTVKNVSGEALGLEYVSSFVFTGADLGCEVTDDKMRLLIPHSAWEAEMQWQEYTMPELGMARVTPASTKRVHISNTGTWSSKEYLPMGVLINDETSDTLMWQIEHNGSWQWELGDCEGKQSLHISGPDERDNGWWKNLNPGESFETVKTAIAVSDSLDGTIAEMTKYRRTIAKRDGADAALPIIFNDYMNCLKADPTEEKELPMIDRAHAAGAELYVIDAGWYADGTWWDTVGEWYECDWRFPHGLKYVLDYIRGKGMIPGLWVEPEVMGINCPIVKDFEDECFFMAHGKKVVTRGRYQLDYRNPKVRKYIMGVFDRLIAEYGVGYFKLDYNIEAGVGTEVGADSLGDGLMGHNRAVLSLLDEVSAKYPDVIFENCSSGGMRMEYASLAHSHIQSTSDQTDYRHYAHIAAAVGTAVLPEQAAVWSYPKACDTLDGVVMNMVNAMPLRVHLSGELAFLSEEQLALVKEGVAVMKAIRKDTDSSIPFYPCGLPTYTDKLFCAAYKCTDCVRIAAWRLDTDDDTLYVPTDAKSVKVLYPSSFDGEASVTDGVAAITLPRPYTAVFIELR